MHPLSALDRPMRFWQLGIELAAGFIDQTNRNEIRLGLVQTGEFSI